MATHVLNQHLSFLFYICRFAFLADAEKHTFLKRALADFLTGPDFLHNCIVYSKMVNMLFQDVLFA